MLSRRVIARLWQQVRRFAARRASMRLGAAAAVALSLLVGCGTPPEMLTGLFGPPIAPRSVAHHARRDPYVRPAPPAALDLKPDREPTDWAALRDQLPKDDDGVVDWVKALQAKLIKPKPGIKPGAEDQDIEDNDVELVPKSDPDMKVVFRHSTHTAWLVCDNCHDAIFKARKGANQMTMKQIKAGEYCGRCHGKVAFDLNQGCSRCHPDS